MTLGMTSSHGLAVIQKTVSTDFLQWKAYRVIEILKHKCKPSDVSAEFRLDQELEKVKFNNAIDYYNDIIGVTAQFEVTKSDT
jgi:aminoglycoside phosphotransferase (APT) family kinase protein